MSKRDEYREKLRTLDNWDVYLMKESGLPGPRTQRKISGCRAGCECGCVFGRTPLRRLVLAQAESLADWPI